MSYNKTNWQDLPNTTTPITASNLNKIENELETLDTTTGTLDAKIDTEVSIIDGKIGGDEYDSTATYEIGDFCIYNNKLYRCTTAISTAEAFTPAHWEETSVEEELDALRKSGGIPTNSVIGYDGSTIPSGFEEIQNYEATYELTSIPSQTVGNNSYDIWKIGKIIVLSIGTIWLNSITSNTWTEIGQLPSSIKPSKTVNPAGILTNSYNGQVIGYLKAEIRADTGVVRVRASTGLSSGVGINFNASWVLN